MCCLSWCHVLHLPAGGAVALKAEMLGMLCRFLSILQCFRLLKTEVQVFLYIFLHTADSVQAAVCSFGCQEVEMLLDVPWWGNNVPWWCNAEEMIQSPSWWPPMHSVHVGYAFQVFCSNYYSIITLLLIIGPADSTFKHSIPTIWWYALGHSLPFTS